MPRVGFNGFGLPPDPLTFLHNLARAFSFSKSICPDRLGGPDAISCSSTKMIIVPGGICYKSCYVNGFCEDDHFFVFPARPVEPGSFSIGAVHFVPAGRFFREATNSAPSTRKFGAIDSRADSGLTVSRIASCVHGWSAKRCGRRVRYLVVNCACFLRCYRASNKYPKPMSTEGVFSTVVVHCNEQLKDIRRGNATNRAANFGNGRTSKTGL